jgi:hypothetical protein
MMLTDDQHAAIRRATTPMDRSQRDAFMAALNNLFGTP